jgi:lambda family phage portal protein
MPGDKFTGFDPKRPNPAFGQFLENAFRIIAVALDMPYELLLKDFSKTNYSSARASMLEAWRAFYRRRDRFAAGFMDPVYWLFLEEQANAGLIDAPDLYENRRAYSACRWVGPGKGWVDPVKEAQAAILRIRSGLSTLEDECAEQGRYWIEVLEQLAREQDVIAELGLPNFLFTTPIIGIDDKETAPGPAPAKPPATDVPAEEAA